MNIYPIYETGHFSTGPLTPPNEAPTSNMAQPDLAYTLPTLTALNTNAVPLAPMTIVKNESQSLSNPTSPSVIHTPSSTTEPATPREKIDHLTKRKRGRPKNPQPTMSSEAQRNATGRSKTGCITCRRRKKKCDEGKPTCKNCDKNNIECEGYSEKTYWRSSKQCCCKVQKIALDFSPSTLPSIYEGLDTPLDATILDHFANRMSWVLTIHNGCTNHFQDRVLPTAYTHRGLMHGLLALSASHMYQAKKEYAVLERQHHHLSAALKILQDEVGHEKVENATMALIMVVCLIHVSDGSTDGIYRWHLQKFRKYLWDGPRAGQWEQSDQEFAAFIYEFYRYHEVHAMLSKIDDAAPAVLEENIASPMPVYATIVGPNNGATIGVLDGLDKLIVRNKALRRHVRERMRANLTPTVDHLARQRGLELEQALKDWDSGQEKETARWYLAEIYRNSSWIVLYRTLSPTGPSPKLFATLDETFEYIRHLPPTDPCQAFLMAPVFRLGCSSFEPRHREKVKQSLNVIAEYSGMGNVGRALEVLERLWRLNDEGDPRGWDPEALMAEMNYDFLIT